MLYLYLLAAAAVVVASGARLTLYGDALGMRVGLSRTWLGVVLFAALTSLPELVATISSQVAVAKPGLVIGNVSGSNLFNLCIFVVLDLMEGPGALSSKLSKRLIRPAMFGLLLMGLGVTGVFGGASYFWLGWVISAAIFALYLFAMWSSQSGAGGPHEEEVEDPRTKTYKTRVVLTRFVFLAIVLVVSGTVFVLLCDRLIDRPIRIGPVAFTMGEGAVGTILLALVTSLPELVVCFAALKLGAANMAIGNLLGSNLFNMALLPVAMVLRPGENLWDAGRVEHGIALGAAIGLTVILTLGFRARRVPSFARVGIDAVLVALIGITAFILVARAGVGL
jgi:cation:H+ antiporter